MDSRRSPRFTLAGEIALSAEGQTSQGTLINLSTGGCAVESDILFQKGDYLGLRVYLAEQDAPVDVDLAAVRWSSGHEYGLEFIRIREEVQKRLRTLLPVQFM